MTGSFGDAYSAAGKVVMIPDYRARPTDRPRRRAASLGSTQRMTHATDLKNIGLKATLPRLRILELFERSEVRHLTAEDVYRMLTQDGHEIGLATVYRVLTQFEQAGLLQRHHFESGKAVFELNDSSHHDHLVCLDCGRVEEFYDSEIEKRQTRVAKERGFSIREHSLYIYAECTRKDCPYRPPGEPHHDTDT
jgi:Fur family ferric uptake transcriptional regulator